MSNLLQPISEWESADGQFLLTIWDTGRINARNGASVLRYEFLHNGVLIFEGSDFCCSPLDAIDGDDAVYALLGFLALRPGDTDAEYFADYTPAQIAWRDMYAEDLFMLVSDYENPESEAN